MCIFDIANYVFLAEIAFVICFFSLFSFCISCRFARIMHWRIAHDRKYSEIDADPFTHTIPMNVIVFSFTLSLFISWNAIGAVFFLLLSSSVFFVIAPLPFRCVFFARYLHKSTLYYSIIDNSLFFSIGFSVVFCCCGLPLANRFDVVFLLALHLQLPSLTLIYINFE